MTLGEEGGCCSSPLSGYPAQLTALQTIRPFICHHRGDCYASAQNPLSPPGSLALGDLPRILCISFRQGLCGSLCGALRELCAGSEGVK